MGVPARHTHRTPKIMLVPEPLTLSNAHAFLPVRKHERQ